MGLTWGHRTIGVATQCQVLAMPLGAQEGTGELTNRFAKSRRQVFLLTLGVKTRILRLNLLDGALVTCSESCVCALLPLIFQITLFRNFQVFWT